MKIILLLYFVMISCGVISTKVCYIISVTLYTCILSNFRIVPFPISKSGLCNFCIHGLPYSTLLQFLKH